MGKTKSLTPEQELEVCEMYERVERGRIVAEAYGVSTETIYRVLRRHGVQRTHRHPDRKNAVARAKRKAVRTDWTATDVETIIKLYKDGLPCSQIGEKFGCSCTSIGLVLRDNGIEMRKCGRKRSLTAPKENREARHKRDKKRRDAISLRRRDGPSHGLKWRDIAERDHMRCQICGCKVDVTDRWVNERGVWCFGRSYPTIDHIIALANGGTDTYDNVQLACKRCNSKKQDKGQLRMVV